MVTLIKLFIYYINYIIIVPSRIPSASNDEEMFTLNELEKNANGILGTDTTRLICKILKKQYAIHLCETSGPKRYELKMALENLLGPPTTRLILGEQEMGNYYNLYSFQQLVG